MSISFKSSSKSPLTQITSLFVAFIFCFTSVIAPGSARAQFIPTPAVMPAVGSMVQISNAFDPLIIKGLTIHPENPLEFSFLVDLGDTNYSETKIKDESQRLITYFMAGLTVPESELWVNLSPYENNRIIPDSLGQTAMGRDLLAQDYLLKQLTASLMYPEDELGDKFWTQIKQRVEALYGPGVDIPTNVFNKVWIMPESAEIYIHNTSVFLLGSRLQVMLEEDYVAARKAIGADVAHMETAGELLGHQEVAEVVREVILPAIEEEVNFGENFSTLRQIFNSIILASWYKDNLKETILGQIYADQNKLKGIDENDKQTNQQIYQKYLEAFEEGVYNYIREEYDPAKQQIIPRKYFSGGWLHDQAALLTHENTVVEGQYGQPLDAAVLQNFGKAMTPEVVRKMKRVRAQLAQESAKTHTVESIAYQPLLSNIPKTIINNVEASQLTDLLQEDQINLIARKTLLELINQRGVLDYGIDVNVQAGEAIDFIFNTDMDDRIMRAVRTELQSEEELSTQRMLDLLDAFSVEVTIVEGGASRSEEMSLRDYIQGNLQHAVYLAHAVGNADERGDESTRVRKRRGIREQLERSFPGVSSVTLRTIARDLVKLQRNRLNDDHMSLIVQAVSDKVQAKVSFDQVYTTDEFSFRVRKQGQLEIAAARGNIFSDVSWGSLTVNQLGLIAQAVDNASIQDPVEPGTIQQQSMVKESADFNRITSYAGQSFQRDNLSQLMREASFVSESRENFVELRDQFERIRTASDPQGSIVGIKVIENTQPLQYGGGFELDGIVYVEQSLLDHIEKNNNPFNMRERMLRNFFRKGTALERKIAEYDELVQKYGESRLNLFPEGRVLQSYRDTLYGQLPADKNNTERLNIILEKHGFNNVKITEPDEKAIELTNILKEHIDIALYTMAINSANKFIDLNKNIRMHTDDPLLDSNEEYVANFFAFAAYPATVAHFITVALKGGALSYSDDNIFYVSKDQLKPEAYREYDSRYDITEAVVENTMQGLARLMPKTTERQGKNGENMLLPLAEKNIGAKQITFNYMIGEDHWLAFARYTEDHVKKAKRTINDLEKEKEQLNSKIKNAEVPEEKDQTEFRVEINRRLTEIDQKIEHNQNIKAGGIIPTRVKLDEADFMVMEGYLDLLKLLLEKDKESLTDQQVEAIEVLLDQRALFLDELSDAAEEDRKLDNDDPEDTPHLFEVFKKYGISEVPKLDTAGKIHLSAKEFKKRHPDQPIEMRVVITKRGSIMEDKIRDELKVPHTINPGLDYPVSSTALRTALVNIPRDRLDRGELPFVFIDTVDELLESQRREHLYSLLLTKSEPTLANALEVVFPKNQARKEQRHTQLRADLQQALQEGYYTNNVNVDGHVEPKNNRSVLDIQVNDDKFRVVYNVVNRAKTKGNIVRFAVSDQNNKEISQTEWSEKSVLSSAVEEYLKSYTGAVVTTYLPLEELSKRELVHQRGKDLNFLSSNDGQIMQFMQEFAQEFTHDTTTESREQELSEDFELVVFDRPRFLRQDGRIEIQFTHQIFNDPVNKAWTADGYFQYIDEKIVSELNWFLSDRRLKAEALNNTLTINKNRDGMPYVTMEIEISKVSATLGQKDSENESDAPTMTSGQRLFVVNESQNKVNQFSVEDMDPDFGRIKSTATVRFLPSNGNGVVKGMVRYIPNQRDNSNQNELNKLKFKLKEKYVQNNEQEKRDIEEEIKTLETKLKESRENVLTKLEKELNSLNDDLNPGETQEYDVKPSRLVTNDGFELTITLQDNAAVTADPVGGIDLNPEMLDLQIKRDASGMPLPVSQQPIINMDIEGFVPVIINITPVTNVPLMLGLINEGTIEVEEEPLEAVQAVRFDELS